MTRSARHVLKGRVVGIEPGAATTMVKIDLGGGVTVTSAISKAAVGDLDLKVGDEAFAVGDETFAVVKASDMRVVTP